MKLKSMIPNVKKLDQRRVELAKRAGEIYKSESQRIHQQNQNGSVDDIAPLHPVVKAESVTHRCKLIMESKEFLRKFEKYNKIFIWAAVICVVVNGIGLCCIAYFTYCRKWFSLTL